MSLQTWVHFMELLMQFKLVCLKLFLLLVTVLLQSDNDVVYRFGVVHNLLLDNH